jgi:hypothetical protein
MGYEKKRVKRRARKALLFKKRDRGKKEKE